MNTPFSNSEPSGKRHVSFAFILAVALGSFVIPEVRAQLIVVPNVNTTNDANSSIFTGEPGPGDGAIRYMLILDASQFGNLSGPSFLTQIALRPDKTPSASGPQTITCRIYASTTRRSVAGMSETFADNLGTNNTLVFDGAMTLSTQNLPGPGNTRQFDIVYSPFTTPFLYDPAAGNLLLDIQYSRSGGSPLRWDSVAPGKPASRGLLGLGSSTAPTGFFIDSSVFQFTFQSAPLVTIRSSQVEVCWTSEPNSTYQVQYSSALTPNLWTDLGGCFRSTQSSSCVYDSLVVGQSQKFYRVIQTDCVP